MNLWPLNWWSICKVMCRRLDWFSWICWCQRFFIPLIPPLRFIIFFKHQTVICMPAWVFPLFFFHFFFSFLFSLAFSLKLNISWILFSRNLTRSSTVPEPKQNALRRIYQRLNGLLTQQTTNRMKLMVTWVMLKIELMMRSPTLNWLMTRLIELSR